MIDQQTYESYRRVNARVLSRVSVVRTSKPWAFFCLSSGSLRAPHWILFRSVSGKAVTELGAICDDLRQRLAGDVEDLSMDEPAAEQLAHFIARLSDAERALLPRKKQRALEEMEKVLERFLEKAAERKDQAALDHYKAILDMIRRPNPGHQPDWDEVAARWLDLIRPVWYGRLRLPRNKPLLLRDIRSDLVAREAELGPQILERFRSFPELGPADLRISACVLGVV